MTKTRVTTIIALTAALATGIVAPAALAAAEPDLHIAIAPIKDERGRLTIYHHKHFNVHFTNRSKKPIRIWDESCQPGHATLSFRITEKSGNSWTMRKVRYGRYGNEYPIKTISIAAGATYKWQVFPTEIQGTYSWTGILEPNSGEDVAIVPIFETKADAQTKERGVWTGRIEGRAVRVRVVNPNLTTPHDYLWNHCPRQALKIMQTDPKWINKEEPEHNRCRPLHHASRFGFVEVVDWLLANGAEVDARAYNDFSPLDFAVDPRVVRAILRHKPKDQERAAAFFRNPLEHAAEEASSGRSDAKKWREIAQLMLDAGAPYSLQVAAYLNDVARVRKVLKENPQLADSLNGSGQTPLRIAAKQGHTEMCKLLLQHKADPNDDGGLPILVNAIAHPAVVKLLLDAGADPKHRISFGWGFGPRMIDDEATALHYAAQDGALESAKLLLDAGIDVNARDKQGKTALDIAQFAQALQIMRETQGRTAPDVAARCRHGEVAHLLASRMGTAEARDKGWQALLYQLVFSGKSDRLKLVLQEKAAADVFAREGPAFMRLAARGVRLLETKREQEANAHNLAIIEMLRVLGIPIDMYSAITSDNIARVKELLKADPALAKSKDQDKRPVLHRAATLDRRAIVVLLLDSGADVNDPDADGFTALHTAAFWRLPGIAKLLIERGAAVDARARAINGFTPLHEAARFGSVEVARLLLAAGAKVNTADKDGRTPLSWAGLDVARLLLAAGAKVDATDKDGRTPLTKARLDDDWEMVELLREHGGEK